MIAVDVGCGSMTTTPLAFRSNYEWYYADKHDFSILYPPGRFKVCDIKDGLPFLENEVDFIWCHHMLEHLPPRHPVHDIDYLIWAVNCFNTVLKPGHEAHLIVPWMEHTNAWRCPTHYRFFNYELWNWFDYRAPLGGEHDASGLIGRWLVTKCEIVDKCHLYGVLVKQ